MIIRLAAMVLLLALAGCEPKPKDQVQNRACTYEEWLRRTPMTAGCRTEMEVMADKATADAERNSRLTRPSPAATRDSL